MYNKTFYPKKIQIPAHRNESKLVSIGDTFNDLTVIEEPYWRVARLDNRKNQFVNCKCKCSQIRECKVETLKTGNIHACKTCSKKSYTTKIQKGTYAKNGKKKCSSCQNYLNLDCFYKAKNTKDGFKSHCKNCHYFNILKKKFNISNLELQSKSKCEICKLELFLPNSGVDKKQKINIDHNHKTNEMRGILCNRCNSCIGYVDDDTKLLTQMIEYLNRHN